ncbi:TPA: acetyltransferase [Streptococcus suis]|uniref:Sugar O-acyltransferase n=1 Tax=Streptococcus suis TaxID=1307 RepID=M1VDH3_STRSU|nr:acetyltransferase [Streptococcus suis]MBS8079603.1 acetyltransferase [Streptococcus suis]MCK3972687.1 acetyltransferase [Streptococcus suis]NQQ72687.1 acetyltransferase [Streptococcus suis]BAM94755.1 sugar O-acyltransferase [Streptococcus suis]HEL1702553.1 acetyltransferase [Streptococcus suis]
MKKLAIIGASGHGKVVADIAEKNGYDEIIFLDDNNRSATFVDYPLVGDTDQVSDYSDWEFIVAIGNAMVRRRILKQLQNLKIATLIHPQAIISRRVVIGQGTVVMAGVVINSDVTIGQGCIINTGSSIDHDCHLSDFVHVSVGARVAGSVEIGHSTWIGAGATVSNNVTLVNSIMIGAGGVVVSDILEEGVYIGVPVRKMDLDENIDSSK